MPCQRSDHETALVLEVTRPALRLLRKLPKFGQVLDETYRRHGLGRVLEDLSEEGSKANERLLGSSETSGASWSTEKASRALPGD